MTAIEKIQPQQKGIENTAPWMVGEQLKDMLRKEPWLQDIVSEDLDQKSMSLAGCEKQIEAFADKNRKGNFACVTPRDAEKIIREFYGLPLAEKSGAAEGEANGVIDLSAFF